MLRSTTRASGLLRVRRSTQTTTPALRPSFFTRHTLSTTPTPTPPPAVQHAARQGTSTAADAASSTASAASSAVFKLGSFVYSSLLLLGTGAFLVYAYDTRAGVHKWVVLPTVMALTKNDPEVAHEWAVRFIGSGLAPVDCGEDDEKLLRTEVWGQTFSSPVGMAAGWDKHATAIDGLFNLGFSYVEVGSVTPEPQPGNPKPRLFRVPEVEAVINRYGFNSEGHEKALERLRQRVKRWVANSKSTLPNDILPTPPSEITPDYDIVEHLLQSPGGKDALIADRLGLPRSLKPGKVLGINLGKNKSSDPDSIDDFVQGVTRLGPYADVLVINVSSPNTPGLRDLQRKGMMTELLQGVIRARDALTAEKKPPVLVKIAPDVDSAQLADIAEAVKDSHVDGIIVSNTTISRPAAAGSSAVLGETGGLSGPPVKALALKALSELYELTDGKVPLVGCGGVASGQDAVDFAKAGASLVQSYTSFIYHGVGLPRKIKDEITDILRKEGKGWSEIIGTGRPVKAVTPPPPKEEVRTGGEDGTTKPLGERDFADSLQEAKADLDALLKELASFSSSSSAATSINSTAEGSSKADQVPPVNVAVNDKSSSLEKQAAAPAPVAESFAPSPSSPEGQAAGSSPGSTPESVSVIQGNFPRQPRIDESKLAVPAQALLDEDAIKTLLDPAGAQLKNSAKEKKARDEAAKDEKPVSGGEARWV